MVLSHWYPKMRKKPNTLREVWYLGSSLERLFHSILCVTNDNVNLLKKQTEGQEFKGK